jgi:F-type H+-transporting ATPase subunit epsilon
LAIELVIVTPERQVYSGPVKNVVLPGSEGDFGVLEHHERFLAPLRIGEALIERDGRAQYVAMSEGFAHVTAERVVVLADTCELADDIDVARAEVARERAARHLREIESGGEEEHRLHIYEAALQRAIVRIGVAGRR